MYRAYTYTLCCVVAVYVFGLSFWGTAEELLPQTDDVPLCLSGCEAGDVLHTIQASVTCTAIIRAVRSGNKFVKFLQPARHSMVVFRG